VQRSLIEIAARKYEHDQRITGEHFRETAHVIAALSAPPSLASDFGQLASKEAHPVLEDQHAELSLSVV